VRSAQLPSLQSWYWREEEEGEEGAPSSGWVPGQSASAGQSAREATQTTGQVVVAGQEKVGSAKSPKARDR